MGIKTIRNTTKGELERNITAFKKRGFTVVKRFQEKEANTLFFKARLSFPGDVEPFVEPTVGPPQQLIPFEGRPRTGSEIRVILGRRGFTQEEIPLAEQAIREGGFRSVDELEGRLQQEQAQAEVKAEEPPKPLGVIRSNFRGPSGRIITEQELLEIQKREAQRLGSQLPRSTPGEKEFIIGVQEVESTPEKITQKVTVGKKTFTRVIPAPEGQQFVVEDVGKKTEFIRATAEVSKEAVQVQDVLTAQKKAALIFGRASPIEKVILRARTLLSERGTEQLGASVLGKPQEADIIVQEKLAQEILLDKGPIEAAVRAAVVEAPQSPIVEIEASALGGAGLLLATTKSARVASFVASKAGKVAATTVTGSLLAVRAGKVKVSLDEGNINKAAGLIITTALDVPAAGVAFRKASPAGPPKATRLKALLRQKGKFEVKQVGDVGEPTISVKTTDVKKTPIKEVIRTSELKGLKKAGLEPITEDVPVKIETIKPGGARDKITVTDKKIIVDEAPKVFVAREVKTGKFVQFGKQVTVARKIGVKSKFPKTEKLIEVKGVERTGKVVLKEASETGIRVIKTERSVEILKPVSAIDDPSITAGKVVGKQLKGTVGTAGRTQPPVRITKLQSGARRGVTISPPRRAGLSPRIIGAGVDLEQQIDSAREVRVRPEVSGSDIIGSPRTEVIPKDVTISVEETTGDIDTVVVPIPKLDTPAFEPSGTKTPTRPITDVPTLPPTEAPPTKPPPPLLPPQLPAVVLTVGGKDATRKTRIIRNPVPDIDQVVKRLRLIT